MCKTLSWFGILAGLIFLLSAQTVFSVKINGSCSFESVQCELTSSVLEVCNDSSFEKSYYSFAKNFESVNWFSVLPENFTLQPGECTSLNVFSVANCYADPGKYFAEIAVYDKYNNSEKTSALCTLNLKQGHFLNVKSSDEIISLNQCEEKTVEVVLENNSIVPNQTIERTNIAVLGLEKSWYSLSSEKVNVAKGSPEKVLLKLHPPCDAEKGVYPFKLRAVLPNPNFYTEKNFSLNISSEQDFSISLGNEFLNNKFETCFEKPENPKVVLRNLGKLEDEIRLSLEGPSWIGLSTSGVVLKPGSVAEVELLFDKENIQKGSFDLKLVGESVLFEKNHSQNLSVVVNDCYALKFSKVSGKEVLCSEEKPTFEFELENVSSSPLTLNVSLSGLPGKISESTVQILPNRSKKLNAEIDVSRLVQDKKARLDDIGVEIVFDVSGSMDELANGEKKIFVAKRALASILDKVEDVTTGFRVFGQGERCEDSVLLVEPGVRNYEVIKRKAQELNPQGMTNMAQALSASSFDFAGLNNSKNYVVLISDGKETCEGNIQEAVKLLKDSNIVVFSIGFDIDEEGKRQLQFISSSTNGLYFDAHDLNELENSLYQVYFSIGIVKGQDAKKKFSVSLKSDNISFERDFSLEIVDCYNAELFMPLINACLGSSTEHKAILYNLGQLSQDFSLQYQPETNVIGPRQLTIAGESKAEIPFTVKADEKLKSVKLTAKSNKISIEKEQQVNLLSDVLCFDFVVDATEKEIDAKTCQGRTLKLYLENKGLEKITLSLSADKNYVYFPEKEISLTPLSSKVAIYFISPPFDLPETTEIKIFATNQNGLKKSTNVRLYLSETQDYFLRNGNGNKKIDGNRQKEDSNGNFIPDLNQIKSTALTVLPDYPILTLALAGLIILMMGLIAFSTLKSIYKH